MIVRESEDGFLLIRQHDHGKISGQFADHWIAGGRPDVSLRKAAWWHDVGWEELDHEVRTHPETGHPYSFIDYPLTEKLVTYRHGLDRVQKLDEVAGCLCSMHYASFFTGTSVPEELQFLKDEDQRQKGLKEKMTEEEVTHLAEGLDFLRLCDDLSLFVCLNPPGINNHPWFEKGIPYHEWTILPHWKNKAELQFVQGLLDEDFTLTIPYRIVNREGVVTSNGTYDIKVSVG
ncbi:Protein of unknown function [Marininema mesophilum]|uniref:HD domain-containing protein n=1 Tax=Marininema mesophilum TaxID=1048340 RepID=A0A1H2YER5_9BACL|nr:DUF3891 family protein [Marininema mesophilum]SDX03702.1 Protein of unknown function [Marininema mesophilum]